MASTKETLLLYRQIVKAAKTFPSIKRVKILGEIRQGFRENKSLAPEDAKVKEQLALAKKGLLQLSQYSSLPRQKGNWSVQMETDPMPKPAG